MVVELKGGDPVCLRGKGLGRKESSPVDFVGKTAQGQSGLRAEWPVCLSVSVCVCLACLINYFVDYLLLIEKRASLHPLPLLCIPCLPCAS